MQSFYRAIGLMSGSSCDGLDIACVDFNHDGQDWSFACIATDCITYTKEWQDHLRQAAIASGHDLMLLHSQFGQFCGQAVKDFIIRYQLTNIDFVASHGHTIFHFPQQHFTTQIGDGAAIAAYCGLPVICDFRSTDIAKNGQGAPLVPMGDALLFKEYRFLLNIGGIANITIQDTTQRTAFDICVANQALNYLASHCGKEFDQDGILASQGRIDHALLQALHQHPYYQKPAPKSLGNEFMQENIKPLLQSSGLDPKDQLHTMCHFIIEQIATSLRHANVKPQDKMLVSGGGASNGFLIGLLKDAAPCEVIIPSPQTIAYKEALIFAFLGVLRWRQETNISAKITGADHDSCGGAIYLA